jgi:steroid 5-alpha reductase family enzyme
MENLIFIFSINLTAVILMMMIGWLLSLVLKNVTVVDSLWGLGFIIIVWLTFFLTDGFFGRKLLIALLVTFWGLRLSSYLTWRNWGKAEDPRYGSWREKSGRHFWIVSLFKVFLLQSVFLWAISLSLQYGVASKTPATITWLDLCGVSLWTVGFIFEAVGDWQLAAFKSNPANKGKVMDRGLWAYTRHPNYFGECLIWWGIFFIALSAPTSWWTILSPLTITAVLLKMTGIPLTEKTMISHRPGYNEYIQRTNAFIPWFPKAKKNHHPI